MVVLPHNPCAVEAAPAQERPSSPGRCNTGPAAANNGVSEWCRALVMEVRCAPEYAAPVRHRVRCAVALPERTADLVELLVSEVFTNAVRHTRSGLGGAVTVAVFRSRDRVHVTLTDAGPRPDRPTAFPRVRPTDAAELLLQGGLGLRLVEANADCWGACHADGGRTTVWFECAISRCAQDEGAP